MKKMFIAVALIAFMGTATFAQEPATQAKTTQETHQVVHKKGHKKHPAKGEKKGEKKTSKKESNKKIIPGKHHVGGKKAHSDSTGVKAH